MQNPITYKALAEQNVKLTSKHLENIYAGLSESSWSFGQQISIPGSA